MFVGFIQNKFVSIIITLLIDGAAQVMDIQGTQYIFMQKFQTMKYKVLYLNVRAQSVRGLVKNGRPALLVTSCFHLNLLSVKCVRNNKHVYGKG